MQKFILLLFLITNTVFLCGQDIISKESFEEDPSPTTYTVSPNFGNPAMDMYFQRGDDAFVTSLGFSQGMNGEDGTNYIVGEEIDGVTGVATDPEAVITTSSTSVTGFSNIEVQVDLGIGLEGNNYETDPTLLIFVSDFIRIEANVDGAGFEQIGFFASIFPAGVLTSPIAEDTDGDGLGDGTELTTTFQTFTYSVAATSSVEVRVTLSSNAANEELALDNIRVVGTSDATCIVPDVQASDVMITDIMDTSFDLSFTAGDGDSRLAVIQEGDPVTATPPVGVQYNADPNFGDGATIDGGTTFAVSDGAATNVTVTGLTPGATYHVAVFEYNADGFCYNTTDPARGNATTIGQQNPELNFANISATVGEDAGTLSAVLCVDITNPDPNDDTTVEVALTGGTGTSDDLDAYQTQTLTFPAGSANQQCAEVTITDDTEVEGDETFIFMLQNAMPEATVDIGNDDTFTLTVEDNDTAPNTIIEFDMTSASVPEDISSSVTICANITNPDDNTPTTVQVVLTNATGTNGTDIEMYNTQTLTFPAASSAQQCISINVTDDTEVEGDETFTFMLQNAMPEATVDIGNDDTFVLTIRDNDVNEPLAIDLISFSAEVHTKGIFIEWATASEQDNKEFILEKKQDHTGFQVLTTIAAAQKAAQYQWLDIKPSSGNNYYRLLQVDTDGNVHEQGSIVVFYENSSTSIHVYPTIVKHAFNIEFARPLTEANTAQVLDIQGKTVFSFPIPINTTTLTTSLPHHLSTGTYFLKIGQEVFRLVKLE